MKSSLYTSLIIVCHIYIYIQMTSLYIYLLCIFIISI
jgi:hypothetical protein